MLAKSDRLLRAAEVCDLLSVSRVTLWRWERAGNFPKRRKIGPNTVGWLKSEVETWLAERPVSGQG